MSRYSYETPYNQWSGNRSDTLNKWKINYKGSIAKASDLPNAGEFKGDTYNVLEDGSNYMWNGSSWDKLDANVYIGATSQAKGIQGLVPPAATSERNRFLRGDGTYRDVLWSMIADKPSTFPPESHTHVVNDITDLIVDVSNTFTWPENETPQDFYAYQIGKLLWIAYKGPIKIYSINDRLGSTSLLVTSYTTTPCTLGSSGFGVIEFNVSSNVTNIGVVNLSNITSSGRLFFNCIVKLQ